MPIPIDARRKPASVKVHVSSGAGIDVTWSDGHASHYDFAFLREQCPCATCNDERREKQAQEQPAPPALSSAALPMYKPKITAKTAHAVGNYALQIDFNDGHATGIYSFDFLRTICPCDACGRQYRSGVETPSQ